MMRLPNNFRRVSDPELEEVEYSPENDINVGVIAFAVTAVVLILVVIFFIKTYAAQKLDVIETLHTESDFLETFCHETFDHNLYVLNLMGGRIKERPNDIEYINSLIKHYSSSADIHALFGWQEFIWVDSDLKIRISSKRGVIQNPKEIRNEYLSLSKNDPEKVLYHADLSDQKSNIPLLRTVMGLKDQFGKYIGTIAINYDVRILNAHLARHKQNNYTNFVLFDTNYNIIMQSKSVIPGIEIKHGKIMNEDMKVLIKDVSSSDGEDKAISYIDMLNGKNYYIKKVRGEPFVLLINVDRAEIRDTIFRSIVMKFLEISIFASMFLLLIVAIYKRETWLRSKVENAYKLAIKVTEHKSDFLAYTAHEIRSPLGFIMTGSEVMCKQMLGPISPQYVEYLEGIHKSATLILDFINDILDEDHILAGNFKIVESANDIYKIIETAIMQNRTRYADKTLNLVLDIEKDLPKLRCDARRILQVISNLLSNSIKYSSKNAEINISAKQKNGEIILKIQDHGIGMSEEDIKVALTKYGTIHRDPDNLVEAFGLGLPIVKLLLDAHEAIFSIESQIDVGTIVTIIFPSYKIVDPKIKGDSNEKQ